MYLPRRLTSPTRRPCSRSAKSAATGRRSRPFDDPDPRESSPPGAARATNGTPSPPRAAPASRYPVPLTASPNARASRANSCSSNVSARRRGVDAGPVEDIPGSGFEKVRKGVAQHLPPFREPGANHRPQSRHLPGRDQRFRMELDPQQRGVYPGPGRERFRRHRGPAGQVPVEAAPNRKGAVGGRARLGGKPERHLLLEHDHQHREVPAGLEEPQEHRGGHAVGQIGHHLEAPLRQEAVEVRLQRVPLNEVELRTGAQGPFAKPLHQQRVHLDGPDAAVFPYQMAGDETQSRDLSPEAGLPGPARGAAGSCR